MMNKLSLLVPALMLSACGGGGATPAAVTASPEPVAAAPEPKQEAFSFVDPNVLAGNRFGIRTVELTNGNIAIRSRGFSVGSGAGAVHLYNPSTNTLIKSFYGADLNYELGFTLKALSNGNLVIASPYDHANGLSDSGSVMLIDGDTGEQIGSTISGDDVNDRLAYNGVTALSNGNYVIASRFDTDSVNNYNQAGSIMLVDGATGVQVGSTIYGDNSWDNIGDKVKELSNGNIVIASPQADNGGLQGVGEVFLMSGTTGAKIGSTITGDQGGDLLGFSGIGALTNGNYVIASPNDDHAGIVDAGTARLVNGTTGAQIATISGADTEDKVASGGIVALMNNEFVVSSPNDNDVLVSSGGIVVSNRGSAKFYNGNTGAQIGSNFIGSDADNLYGSGGIFQLSNGNIVISTPFHEIGLPDQGRVDLINAAKSTHIAILYPSLDINPRFGFSGVHPVGDGNFTVVSQHEDSSSLNDVGTVRVFNGTTGAQVGTTVFGDNAGDSLGNAGVKVLDNGNFIVASVDDDVNGVSDAGSVMLFNGTTGAQIGASIVGTEANDELAQDGVFVLKGNNNYVIASSKVDANGLADVGSVILVDGSTGVQIGEAIMGDDANDKLGASGGFADKAIVPLADGNYLIANINNDDNGNADIGKVLYQIGK